MAKKRRSLRSVSPGKSIPNRHEHIVLGGVAFYLDHEHKLAVPMNPDPILDKQDNNYVTKK